MSTDKRRLGCLHMHHSNIGYVDSLLSPGDVEVVHFVEPGLMRRIGSEDGLSGGEARAQVQRQLDWMASCGLDAILITCTNYIATLPDEPLDLPVPVIKIDEPFFADLLEQGSPHLLLFTNPATVEGTMRRYRDFARAPHTAHATLGTGSALVRTSSRHALRRADGGHQKLTARSTRGRSQCQKRQPKASNQQPRQHGAECRYTWRSGQARSAAPLLLALFFGLSLALKQVGARLGPAR